MPARISPRAEVCAWKQGSLSGRKYLTGYVFTGRVAAQDIDGYARLEIRGGSIGPLVLWTIQMIDHRSSPVMPGLDPGIHRNRHGHAVERGWPGQARP